MKRSFKRPAHLLIICFLLILPSYADDSKIECYNCNSKHDKGCETSNVDARHKVECPSGTKGCRKLDYEYRFERYGEMEKRIVRQCSKRQDALGCELKTGTNGERMKVTYCECRGQLCNAAFQNASSSSFLELLTFVGVFWWMVQANFLVRAG